jgi:hypothetical protein
LEKKLRFRVTSALVHLCISLVVVSAVSLFIYFVWFPPPFFDLCGGLQLLTIVFIVDVVIGPFLTLIAMNPKKERAEIRRDLFAIASIQLIALVYGVYILVQARPVYIVFDGLRIDVTRHADVTHHDQIPVNDLFRSVPWLGPNYVYAAAPSDKAQLDIVTQGAFMGKNRNHYPFLFRQWSASSLDLSNLERVGLISSRKPQLASMLADYPADYYTVPGRAPLGSFMVVLDKSGSMVSTLKADAW